MQDISTNKYNDYPLTVWEWIYKLFLLIIPIVGTILALVWAFSKSTNENIKNFCRASLILGVIAIFIYQLLMFCII